MRRETFHTPEPVELELRVVAGEVRVETSETAESTIELEGLNDAGRRAVEDARIELAGRRLEVAVEKRGFVIGFTIGRGPAVRVVASVPDGSSVDVKTVSADVAVDGRVAKADLKAVSGDVRIESVEGDLDLKSVSGDLFAGRVGGRLDANTVSGDVQVREVGRGARVKTVSGDQTIESVAEGEVRIQSVSGDVRVGIAPGASVWMDVRSVSGKTTSQLEPTDAPASDAERAVEVRGNTVSGDVTIGRAA
jgi:DUF4097 and DUF4098 domain-containing protein YvlB